MPTPITYTAHYAATPDRVHGAFTDRAYWDRRIAEVGGDGARIESVTATDGGVEVVAVQSIPASSLPSVVTAIRPGDLVITRTEKWGPLTDGRASGEFTARVDGLPGQASGSAELGPDGDGATVVIDGRVEVKVPFVGGTVEGLIRDNVSDLLHSEEGFTRTWLAG